MIMIRPDNNNNKIFVHNTTCIKLRKGGKCYELLKSPPKVII